MIELISSPSYALLKTTLASKLSPYQTEGMIEYVEAGSTLIQTWLPQALGGSLWAQQKITVIHNAYFFAKGASKQPVSKEQDETLLARLLETKDVEENLIFMVEGEVDERLSLVKAMKKHHTWLDIPIPKKDGWYTYLSTWQKTFGVEFTTASVQALVDRTYPDFDRCYQEVQKLASLASKIDEKMVFRSVKPPLEDNVFELTNHLMQDNLTLAYQTFLDLMRIQVEPTMLIALLGKHFQLFAKVCHLLDEKEDVYKISQLLKVHEYRVRLMAQAKKRFSLRRLNQILLSLDTLDQDIKKGRQDKVEALSWWLVHFTPVIS
jgi:DNA polymerase III subunit delta